MKLQRPVVLERFGVAALVPEVARDGVAVDAHRPRGRGAVLRVVEEAHGVQSEDPWKEEQPHCLRANPTPPILELRFSASHAHSL